ncbi:undecaprenyl-diphosphate phosphatase [Bacillus sp. AK031]
MLKSYHVITVQDIDLFITGFASAFFVAILAIMFFLKLLSKVKLTPFAYYRFALAGIAFVYNT